MIFVRSLACALLCVIWTALWCIIGPLLLTLCQFLKLKKLPTFCSQLWARGLFWAARALGGVHQSTEGSEHLNPTQPMIIACNHQSAWDIAQFFLLIDKPVFIMKKELCNIPFLGLCARKLGMIVIDRNAGAAAVRSMLRQARQALELGAQLIIFPEGTRTKTGGNARFHPGVTALYKEFGDRLPVIPTALNSGTFWGRHGYLKRPGTMVVRFMAPMESGLGPKTFLQMLKQRIGSARDALNREDEKRLTPN